MNHASQPDEHEAGAEGARPVHPDGEVDAPGSGSPQYGGTTGAEHDGGDEQIAAEAQDATDVLDGRSPQGAAEPVDGAGADPIAGTGSPVEGAGS